MSKHTPGPWRVDDIRINTAANWAIPHLVGSASLWGIESDSGADYFAQVEAELIADAREDLRQTIVALKYCGLDYARG